MQDKEPPGPADVEFLVNAIAHDPSELKLVSLARDGNREARRALVEAHGPAVLALCRRLDPEPEDAFQDIWIHLFHALEHYDTNRPPRLRAWILTVSHRHLIDRHRKRGRRGVAIPFDERIADRAPNAHEALAARREAERLHEAIDTLAPEQRRAVLLHHLGGTAITEIAESEGVGVNTIKSRLHRGRARLATLLGGDR